eukprot:TRINITY_DN11039_c0_g1_i1.p1 TRINITY_DN11039_c0_g1~~TRINITY_DN11039_c0_g1_i1.p1  ORF type:complete len:192 (-),score=33.66 TRINITY_DN11039_c0_g1_i1:44-619(-)
MICVTFSSAAVGDWISTFFSRYYGMSLAVAGTLVGVLSLVTGVIGGPSGALLADAFVRCVNQPYFFEAWIVTAVGSLGFALAVMTKTLGPCLVCVVIANVATAMGAAPMSATLNNSVSANMRGRAGGTAMLLLHLLGDSYSATLVGYISDVTGSLITALLICPVVYFLAVVIWFLGWLIVRQQQWGLVKRV